MSLSEKSKHFQNFILNYNVIFLITGYLAYMK
jgi:hypothetical protein